MLSLLPDLISVLGKYYYANLFLNTYPVHSFLPCKYSHGLFHEHQSILSSEASNTCRVARKRRSRAKWSVRNMYIEIVTLAFTMGAIFRGYYGIFPPDRVNDFLNRRVDRAVPAECRTLQERRDSSGLGLQKFISVYVWRSSPTKKLR